MNNSLLAVDVSSRNVTPVWGIGAILGLVGLLGFVVFQRLTEEDRSWTRWEKHELTGVVLGQNPDQEHAPVAEQTRRSPATPDWAKAPSTSAASSARLMAGTSAAPAQRESADAADPFTKLPSPAGHREEQEPSTVAPRRLFQDDAHVEAIRQMPARSPSRTADAAQDPAFRGVREAVPLDRQTATPAELDFATSSRGQRPAGATSAEAARYHRGVQQAAGIDETSESLFPGPAPAGQMPIQSLPAEENSLPQVEQNISAGGIPASPNELSLDPLPVQQFSSASPAAPPQSSGFEPQPTLSMPEPQSRNIPSLPQPDRISNPLPQESAARMPPREQTFSASPVPQQTQRFDMPQPQNPQFDREPIPRAASGRSMMTTPATPPADTVKPDEVYQVQSGDNYWTISRRYYGSARFFSALSEYNKHRIPVPEKMKPGMYVLVPDVEVLHQQYPQLTGGGPRDPAESAPPGFFVDASGQPCYRIGKGDTLSDIAQTHLGRSSRWVQIQAMNQDRLENGKTLKIGQVLRLPADASQIVLAPADSEIR